MLRKREGQGERIVEGARVWLDSGTSWSWGRRGLSNRGPGGSGISQI